MGRWRRIYSANKVVVAVEIVAHTIANMIETILVDDTARVTRWLGNIGAVLQVSLLLHLTNSGSGGVLLTIEEGVVFLRDLETTDRVEDESANCDEGTKE